MDNPEYTERMIQKAIDGQTGLPITISWNGYDPEPGETANFEIYLDGCDTNVFVWDHGGTFDIYIRDDRGVYGAAGWAVDYDKLAEQLIEIIEEDIASGKLGEEE